MFNERTNLVKKYLCHEMFHGLNMLRRVCISHHGRVPALRPLAFAWLAPPVLFLDGDLKWIL